jgi:phosphonatase-like hydrolase
MIKLAVFDLAGTTVEDNGSKVSYYLQQSLADFGFNFSLMEIDKYMGIPKPEAIRALIGNHYLVDAIHKRFVYDICEFYRTDSSVREISGATKTFKEIRDMGIKVALNTGFSRPITNTILERMNWKEGVNIDASISSDEVEKGRPYPDMISKLMNILNIDSPDFVCKVGDTPSDLMEGTNAGCKLVIGVLSGVFDRKTLEQYKHTNILKDITEIPRLILHLDPEV